jgi:hypothetical protein
MERLRIRLKDTRTLAQPDPISAYLCTNLEGCMKWDEENEWLLKGNLNMIKV